MAIVTYQTDKGGIESIVRSRNGPVARDLRRRAIRLQTLARRQVGKRTGRLAASIHTTFELTATGLQVTIGSSSRHAYLHHEGSRPHVIVPKHAGTLRFSQGGRIVYARKVMHPGTKPNRYLTDNLRRVV